MKLLRKVYGFAESRRKLQFRLSDAVDRIQEQLIKCFMFPSCQDVPHWKVEIRRFFPRIKKQANTNDYPSAKFIVNNTWKIVEDASDDMYDNIRRWYTPLTPAASQREVYAMCEEFFVWWAEQLSEHGAVEMKAVSDKIDTLISKQQRGMYR